MQGAEGVVQDTSCCLAARVPSKMPGCAGYRGRRPGHVVLPSGEGAVEDVGLHERRRVANAPSKMPRILVAIDMAREHGVRSCGKGAIVRAISFYF